MIKLKVGEYEIIEDLSNGVFKCLRHGEEWRNLAGDNMILSLVSKIEELTEQNQSLQEDSRKLNALENWGVDNWSGYGDALSSMDDDDED